MDNKRKLISHIKNELKNRKIEKKSNTFIKVKTSLKTKTGKLIIGRDRHKFN